jgi:hypothetical protein
MVAHTLLAGSLLDLGGGADTDETVVRLELLQGLGGVVDEGKAGALTTTVLCAETEDGDLVLVGLVQVGQLLAELVLGDVGAVGVEDVPRFAKMSDSVFSGCCLVSVCVCVYVLCFRLQSFFCSLVGWSSDFNFDMRSICISTTHRSKGKIQGGFLHDHLLTGKQRVADELASPQSDGSVGHFGVCVGWRKCRRGH